MVHSIIPCVEIDFYSDDFDPHGWQRIGAALAANSHSFTFCGCLRFNAQLRKVRTFNIAPQIVIIPTTLL